MTILQNDIKLVASSVMDDVPEGGGAPTAIVIADGASNAIFRDISELDRAGGDVSLRKLFVHVQTDNVDTYLGSNLIVAEPPADPNVSVTLFSIGDTFDERESASGRVESYLGAGSELGAYLLENHVQGQRAIQLFSRPTATLPSPGETLVLRWHLNQVDQKTQFVRATKISSEVRQYSILVGSNVVDYQGMVTTVEISDALREDFVGSPPSNLYSKAAGSTSVLQTIVTDAASYAGCVALSSPITLGDRIAHVDSVYTQLVPSSQTENVVLDQNPAATHLLTLATAPRLVQVAEAGHTQRIKVKAANRSFNYVSIFTPLPAPGSVTASYRALGRWYDITDNGDGTMGGRGAGSISYATGSISITTQVLPDVGSDIIFSWGATTEYVNHSGEANFRAPEHCFQLDDEGIVPGTVEIGWTSGGVVKSAVDNGTGKITGDAVGEINYVNGQVWIRPTALMDAGGEYTIDYQWRDIEEQAFNGLIPDAGGFVQFNLTYEPAPGSISVIWGSTRISSQTSGSSGTQGSSTKSNGSNTTVATTRRDYTETIKQSVFMANPVARNQSTGLHDAGGSGQIVGYADGWFGTQNVLVPKSEDMLTSTTTTNSANTSASLTVSETRTGSNTREILHIATDDGAGSFLSAMGTALYSAKSITIRTISDWSSSSYRSDHENANDFAAANDSTSNGYNPGQPVSSSTGGSSSSKGGTWNSSEEKEEFSSASLICRYCKGTSSPQSGSTIYQPPGIVIDLAPYTQDHIVPGSVQFTWMGVVYVDFEGLIYRGRTSSNPGIVSGFIDYRKGVAGMTSYTVGAGGFTLNSLWTAKGTWQTASIFFRTPVAPLKPGGLIFSVLDVSGNQIIVTADLDGVMTGTHCIGKIDYDTGVCEVLFGDYVLNSSLTDQQKTEWWYNPSLIGSTGLIWKPWPVDPQTLRYNAVSYFYLPLDAEILGLDPVRLPQDGRVPIFRPGAFAVVGHTATTSPATATNGGTVNVGRVRLSRVRVIGNNGAVINSGYSVDLEAGVVTFDNVTGYSQPVRVEHRIEDMVQVSDVDIGGTLAFTRAITHNYPDGSYVSSALISNDLKARNSIMFDQASWDAVTWSDTPTVGAAAGTYNKTLAPVLVTNRGAVTERWALRFISTTSFQVIGEHVGIIEVGNINSDCSPINPATGTPYFTVFEAGWGLGWAIGNIVRLNTIGAQFPVWCVRTVQQGAETVLDDSFTLLVRGDVDRP